MLNMLSSIPMILTFDLLKNGRIDFKLLIHVSDMLFHAVLDNHFLFFPMCFLKYLNVLTKYTSFPSLTLFRTRHGGEVL